MEYSAFLYDCMREAWEETQAGIIYYTVILSFFPLCGTNTAGPSSLHARGHADSERMWKTGS